MNLHRAVMLMSTVLAGMPPPRAAAAVTTSDEVWSVHGQSTVVEQWHGDFPSPYAGANSLKPAREDKHTITATLFLGHGLWPDAELFYNPEVSQGTGLSDTVGLAGFPNGEATRAGARHPQYNTARLFLRETIGLGGEREKVDAAANALGGARDVDRLTVTIGKLSASDIFDSNRYSHDPRTQFLNWALMDNGAWDYPADVKGYTGGVTVEWNVKHRAVRWGALLEPKEANGRPLDPRLRKALGQVVEWEERYTLARGSGAVRVLGFWNRARMGSYAEALRLAPSPDVTATRRDSSKAGLALNWEQDMGRGVGLFGRAGFNDGQNETWAFTEIDRTVSMGVSVGGARWGRPDDTFGFAGLMNGLSEVHRRYLGRGGYGFIVGDGRLRYGTERVAETYYQWRPMGWLAIAFDAQLAQNPGYNRDRGPVPVFALRSHLEF